jgi:DNA-binding transcriptional MerR regulator
LWPSRSTGGQRRYSRTEVTVVRYVAQLADEGLTRAAIRRVLELEDQVRALQAERDALLTARTERDELLAALTSRRRASPALQGRRPGSPRFYIRESATEHGDRSRIGRTLSDLASVYTSAR